MNKKTLLILSLFLSIFQIGSSQTSKTAISQEIPLKKHFKPNDYNGGIQSWSFDQDNSGILYVANNDGLLEFDGRKWNKYVVPFSPRLRAVKVDRLNRIFVGGQGQIGYFTKTENNLVFTSLLEYLPEDKQDISETWKILELDDKIFFNTESELFVYDNNTIRAMALPGYLRFIFKVEKRLFAQFYEQGLYEIVNNKFIHIKDTEIEHDIVAILPNERGNICLTREGEIYLLDKLGLTQVNLSVKLGTVNDALKLSTGEYVIGTQSNGLYIFNSNLTLKKHLTKNKGLSDRTIKSLYEDQFQNLWVALHNGIDYLKLNLPFSLINEELGVEGTGYAAIKYKDQIYLGTNNGAFVQKDTSNNLQPYPFDLINGGEGQVYNFSKVENELILNYEHGAFELKGEHINQIQDIGSWKFMNTKTPNLIIGGGHRGISFFKKKNDEWLKTKNVQELDESSRIMEFENDSTLWMTHSTKGAYRIEFNSKRSVQKKITLYGKNDGFPSNTLINVYSLNDKLVFTSEKGIYDFNLESHSFTKNIFLNKWLGTDHVSQIISNDNNSIYYIQNKQFGELKQIGFGSFENERNLFKHINKYINDDLSNISILDKNNILIGAKEGFIQYNPNQKLTINKNFKTLLRSVKIQSSTDSIKTFNPTIIDNIKIAEKHPIKFEYAAPYFDGFEDLKYSYRLLPISKNWSKWTTSSGKEYTHLPFDKYRFEVKAQNIYGIESDIAALSFEVLTPWYFTKWAKGGYLFFVLIAFILYPLIQRKKFIEEKSIITKSKDKTIKIKDEEIHKLTHEKLKSELDLKNDQLTGITMQLMKSNEFIQDVQNKIVTSLDKSSSKQELKKIINTIDKELSNNDSWDQFAYHFDQVHGNYLKKLASNNIRLSPREIKLAAFLRMNMSSKEISKLLSITVRGVELSRYRLRKKLKLERDQNLVEYLIELDNN